MAYLDDMRSWAQRLPYQGGKWEDHGKTNWLISSPFREDRNPSFSIDLVKRTCLDRASGEKMLLSEFCEKLRIEEPSREDGKSLSSRGQEEAAQVEKDRTYILDVWNRAAPAPADFPYLQRKQVPPNNCRTCYDKNMKDHVLIVPAYNASGDLVGLERIPATQGQDKKHLKQKKGAYHLIGTISEGKPLYVAEGYATAASLHLITGQPVAVAFTAWNLEPVCQIFKARYKVEPYACPDAGDAGRKAAAQCRAAGFRVVELPPESRNGLDWNDVMVEQGLEPAKALFRDRWAVAQAEKVEAEQEGEDEVNILDLVESPSPGTAQKPEKVWHFPRKHLNLVAADPGMGKSILMTKVASDLSIGVPVLGMIAEPVRKTLYLNGECGKDYFNWRFKASGWEYSAENFCVVHQEVLADNGVDLDLDTPQGRKNLESLLDAKKPDLLIIDSLPAFSDEDLNDGKAQNVICKHLKTLASKYNLAVVLITHLRKRRSQDQGAEPTLSEIQGSNAGAKLCNVALVIYESPVEIEGEERVIKVCKSVKAWGPKVLPFGFSFPELGEDELILHLEELPERHNQPQGSWDRVRNALQYTEFTRQSVENLLGISDRTAKNLLAEWQQKGKIERFGHGKNTAYQVTKDYAGTRVSISSPNQEKPVIASNDTGTSLFTESGPQEESHSVKNSFTESNPVISIDDEDSVKYIDSASPKTEMSVSHSVKGDSQEYFLSRGSFSLSAIAARAGVPMASVREELVRWQDCGRVSLDGDGTIHLVAGTSFPGQVELEPEDDEDVPPEDESLPVTVPPTQPGQRSLLFPEEEEPKAPAPPPVIKDETPSTPRGADRSGPPPGWLEYQSDEVKTWHAENLKRLFVIGVPEPEETALLQSWERFGKSF